LLIRDTEFAEVYKFLIAAERAAMRIPSAAYAAKSTYVINFLFMIYHYRQLLKHPTGCLVLLFGVSAKSKTNKKIFAIFATLR
jgi:hypothetical protein